MSQSSSVASPYSRRRATSRAVDAQLDAGVAQLAKSGRQERVRRVDVDEQRLGRVADAGPLGLGVDDDPLRGVEVGGRVDVDVAVARRRVDHRHRGDRLQRLLQPLATARDDEVDEAVLGGELGQLLAPAAQQRHRALGQPGRRLGGHRGEHGVGVRRRRRAAQHDRVARLQAQRGGVDRHVRARLVDDGDDPEWHALAAHGEPVGEPAAVEHLADRIGQRGDVAHLAAIPATRSVVEPQPVHQRGGQPGLAPGLHVPRVGLEDLAASAPRARRRSRAAPRPWRRGRAWRACVQRPAGGPAEFGDCGSGDGHGPESVGRGALAALVGGDGRRSAPGREPARGRRRAGTRAGPPAGSPPLTDQDTHVVRRPHGLDQPLAIGLRRRAARAIQAVVEVASCATAMAASAATSRR